MIAFDLVDIIVHQPPAQIQYMNTYHPFISHLHISSATLMDRLTFYFSSIAGTFPP